MIEKILRFSIQNRLLVVLIWIVFLLFGLQSAAHLNIDAVPDVTNVQVQVNALSPALGPMDVERRITFPLEVALGGLPKVRTFRSVSQFGLSQVTVIFEDDTNVYFARQLVNERLQEAREQLPPNTSVQMAPVSTGLGEVLYLRLNNPKLSLMERRRLMDWVVRPQLRTVPGLAEVNVWGGEVRQLQVQVNPWRLREFGLDLDRVARAINANNSNGGGAFVPKGAEQQLVTTQGLIHDVEDIAQIPLKQFQQIPITVAQVADIRDGPLPRQGALTQDGKGEEVYAICMLLLGQNGFETVARVKAKLAQVESALPAGTKVETFLDRSRLIQSTLNTATKNLTEGGLLVIGLLFLFLLQLRAGMIVSSAIPLAMLAAMIGMRYYGISANLMSLGAIDFGLIVDGAVIIVENCVRRLSEEQDMLGRDLTEDERLETIASASVEVRSATQLGELIIISTYLPILSLEGIEGKMFRPMGWTVVLALAGATVMSFTLIPALCGYFLKAHKEGQHPLIAPLERLYSATLEFVLRRPLVPLAVAVLSGLVALGLFTRLGSEFIPELDEGAIAVQVTYPTGISLKQSIIQSMKIEALVHQTLGPDTTRVVTRIGRPEIATDPMLTSQTDVIIELVPSAAREAVVNKLSAQLEKIPGIEVSFTQPIKMRMMELIEGIGIRADLGIKVFGADHSELKRQADKLAEIVKTVPGATDVVVETTEGLPHLRIDLDRQALSQYALDVDTVNRVVDAALGGKAVSSINDGNERFDIAVTLAETYRVDPAALETLLIPTPGGQLVPLNRVAKIVSEESPVQVSREQGKRRVVVQSNVRGRDLGSYVEEVQQKVQSELKLPVGYYLEYGGTYEQLKSGRARLLIVVPLTFSLVFGLLFLNFGKFSRALVVFSGIPLAVTGGVAGLWLRGMPLSISASIGFIALAGVAVLNGVVMVTFIESLIAQGKPWLESISDGARLRLRPVLMTASVASFGFVPMALSTGAGAEVQKPLATVIIGGLITSTALTLVVLPALYRLLHRGDSPSTTTTTNLESA